MTSPKRSDLRLAAATALLIAAGPLAAPASAAGLRVAPNQLDVRVQDGSELPPITLTNTGRQALAVDVAARPAKQARSGLPVYDVSERALKAGWSRLELRPRSLVIPPGERRTVRAVVRGASPRPGRYGVVLFTARAAGVDGPVSAAVRLAANVLLRFPGFVTTTGAVNGAWAEQGDEPRTLRFVARLQNSGNLHTHGSAALTVLRPDGSVALRRRFGRELVLPGAARDLPLVVRDVLEAGDYTARVTAHLGGTRSERAFRLRLVGPNELPTPRLEIVELERPKVDAGERFDARLAVRNTGTAALRPGAALSLRPAGGSSPVGGGELDLPAIGPGEEVERKVPMPALERGAYELDAELWDRNKLLDEQVVAFDTDAGIGWWDGLRDWMARNVVLVLAAGILLTAGALGAGLAVGGRRRGRRRAYS